MGIVNTAFDGCKPFSLVLCSVVQGSEEGLFLEEFTHPEVTCCALHDLQHSSFLPPQLPAVKAAFGYALGKSASQSFTR